MNSLICQEGDAIHHTVHRNSSASPMFYPVFSPYNKTPIVSTVISWYPWALFQDPCTYKNLQMTKSYKWNVILPTQSLLIFWILSKLLIIPRAMDRNHHYIVQKGICTCLVQMPIYLQNIFFASCWSNPQVQNSQRPNHVLLFWVVRDNSVNFKAQESHQRMKGPSEGWVGGPYDPGMWANI